MPSCDPRVAVPAAPIQGAGGIAGLQLVRFLLRRQLLLGRLGVGAVKGLVALLLPGAPIAESLRDGCLVPLGPGVVQDLVPLSSPRSPIFTMLVFLVCPVGVGPNAALAVPCLCVFPLPPPMLGGLTVLVPGPELIGSRIDHLGLLALDRCHRRLLIPLMNCRIRSVTAGLFPLPGAGDGNWEGVFVARKVGGDPRRHA
eukprot:1853604-Heterocapsa_arctica.AAC.1